MSSTKTSSTKRLIIKIPERHLISLCASVALPAFLIKRDWIRYVRGTVRLGRGDYFVINWDTAMKAAELEDRNSSRVRFRPKAQFSLPISRRLCGIGCSVSPPRCRPNMSPR